MSNKVQISIIIPCRNEKPFIKKCVDAIYQCDLPENAVISVFVVDGMSDDGTRDVIQELKLLNPNLHLIDNIQKLTPYAFNLGIYAGGKVDYVQIVGARHILSKNYLINCLSILKGNKEVWCVGGKIINEFVNDEGRIISYAMSTSFGMGLGNFRTLEKSGFTDTVTSPMYPYWVFERIGYFDEELIRNQDDDFNFRVTKAGGKIYFDSSIHLRYYVRGNFKGLWRQFFQYGYWKVFVNKKHKAVTTIRQLVPPLFVFYSLLFPFSAIFGTIYFIIAVLPLLLYILMGISVSFKILSENKTDKLNYFKLFRTFPILHFSYGLGYLKGILDFLSLNKKPSDRQKRLSR